MAIVCGWCGAPTVDRRFGKPVKSCDRCGRDPRLAWEQRGQEPPQAKPAKE